MLKSISFSVFFISIALLLTNCNGDDCGNLSSQNQFFDINGIDDAYNFKYINSEIIELEEGNLVNFDEYGGIRFLLNVEYVAEVFEQKSMNWSFFPTAYACTPLPAGAGGAKTESIVAMEITTIFPFDSLHAANTLINDKFTIQPITTFGSSEGIQSIAEFLIEQESEKVQQEVYFLRPMNAPVLTDDFQVKIKMELSNGEIYESLVDPIKLIL